MKALPEREVRIDNRPSLHVLHKRGSEPSSEIGNICGESTSLACQTSVFVVCCTFIDFQLFPKSFKIFSVASPAELI